MVNADPATQLRLLDLQALDTGLNQLAHRRATLPELALLAECDRRGAELHARAVEVQTELSDIASEQARLEADIDVVRQRETRDQQRMTAGGLPGKELESLQHELGTLSRRQSVLEDSALEVMEQREALETTLAEVAARQESVAAERARAETARDAAVTDIDAAATQRTRQRTQIAADIPADLLGLYDKVRQAQGGVGAAALRQRRCEGCRLELAGSELGAVRQAPPDAVLRCENCRRILVRTSESGL